MKNLLNKEIKLASSPITYFFLAFSLMVFFPGYPILMSSFFICMGLFQSFQSAREANDITYTVLLPVEKSDVVKSKYIFTCFIQIVSFVLMTIFTIIRMNFLNQTEVFEHNVLMSANPLFLAFTLLMFIVFNWIFVNGYFKTAYKIGVPFIFFVIASMIIVGISEALHHLPGLSFLNDSTGDKMWILYLILLLSILVYVGLTWLACKSSQKKFEKIDL